MALTHRDTFDTFGIAYRAIQNALDLLGDARAALVALVDNPVAEENEIQLRAVQKELRSHALALYQAASGGGQVVLLRPLSVPGRRIIKRFNDEVRPGGPRSEGLVFDANLGDPVIAPCDGVVKEAGVMGGVGSGGYWGKRIAIASKANPTVVVWLAHLDAMDVGVGDTVNVCDTIGRAGQSGNAQMPQVLMVVEVPGGLSMPGVPFPVADPWPLLFDKDASDAYYLEVPKVE